MRTTDLHMHTVFSDGKNTPEEMVLTAISLGMSCIGFSDHSDDQGDYGLKAERIPEYIAEIERVKQKYAEQIRIRCGYELDLLCPRPKEHFEYVIGSVHALSVGGGHYALIDHSAETQLKNAELFFGGDMLAFTEAYFDAVAGIVDATDCDIIGHFDLVSKFNEGNRLFDSNHPRYIAAWQRAADRLLKTGKPFEFNTGAITRGYRTTPYPELPVYHYLRDRGAHFMWNSDSHSTEHLKAFVRMDFTAQGYPAE